MSFNSVSRLISQNSPEPLKERAASSGNKADLALSANLSVNKDQAIAARSDDQLKLQSQAPRLKPLQVILADRQPGVVVEPGVSDKTRAALSSVPGTAWAGRSAANGGRELAILIPESFNPDKPVEVMFYFHGHGGTISNVLTNPDKGLAENIKALSKERNLIVVMPQGPAKERDFTWMNPKNKESLADLQQEVWTQLAQMQPGLNPVNQPEQIQKVVLAGHSAGGLALMNGLSGTQSTVRADRVDFLDASYGSWASEAHSRLKKRGLPVEMRVVYLPGTQTEADALGLKNTAGVSLVRGAGGHGAVPRRYLGL